MKTFLPDVTSVLACFPPDRIHTIDYHQKWPKKYTKTMANLKCIAAKKIPDQENKTFYDHQNWVFQIVERFIKFFVILIDSILI